MTKQIATPYDYGKYKIIIIPADGGRVDVSNITFELSFFESLKDPFVSGTFVVLDSANVFNYVNFMGQEQVDIEVTDIYNSVKIKKTFAITNIRKQEKTSDNASSYVVSFSDLHLYINEKKTFSKTYNGKPESILQQISQEHLGKSVSIASSSAQAPMRVITPFDKSPLQNMMWLKNRCTTGIGAPFYLHASLYNDNLQLISLSDLLGQGAFNREAFNYTSPNKTADTAYTRESFESLTFKIATMNFALNQDAVLLMGKDTYGAHYNFIDTFQTKALEEHFDITAPLGALPKPNGVQDYIPQLPGPLGDPLHIFPKSNSDYLSQIVTRKLFENINSYNEEQTLNKHMLKAKSKGVKEFVTKGIATFQMPGFAFLGKDLIGKQQIDVYIPKDLPIEEDRSRQFVKDKKRSGKYVITNIRNMFKNSQHYVTVTGIKIDNDPQISSEQFYKG